MKDAFVVNDLEQLKALADPLRRRVLMAFCCAPATTKQIAVRLGEKPTRLYHHVETLEKAGLVRLVRTRPNRGTVEKYYVTVGRQFVVDPELLRVANIDSDAETEVSSVLVNALQESLAEACRCLDAAAMPAAIECCGLILRHARVRLTRSQADAFARMASQWLDANATSEAGGEEPEFSLTIALFPVRRDSAAPEEC